MRCEIIRSLFKTITLKFILFLTENTFLIHFLAHEMQFNFLKTVLLILLVSALSACIAEKHAQEKAQYKKAKQSKEILSQVKALETLAALEPQSYQSELTLAQKAASELEIAQSFQLNKNWYQGYLFAHNSYRTFTSKEAKEILVSSGKHFVNLIKIRTLIEKSYQLLPKDIFNQMAKYNQQPVAEWNVVDFNQLLTQLTLSSLELSRAAHLAKQDNNYPQEILNWFDFVKQHARDIAEYRNFLVSQAINASAKELLLHNKTLTQEAIKLLAYVKPDIALNGLQPKFNETFLSYLPYQELMHNIYLSISSAGKKHAVDWYSDWAQVEEKVLMREGEFSLYTENSKYRRYIITKIALENTSKFPTNQATVSSVESFIGADKPMKNFLDKLVQDKTYLF